MSVNQSKTMVISWLTLSVTGVVACWASLLNGQFETIYGLPSVIGAAMLMWIRQQPEFYAMQFYRLAWQVSMILLWLLLAPGCYHLAQQF